MSDECPRRADRRRIAFVGVLSALMAAPWLALIPGAVWHGLVVVERCDDAIRSRYGDDVHLVQGEERVRLMPPGWVCPASNGGTEHIWP